MTIPALENGPWTFDVQNVCGEGESEEVIAKEILLQIKNSMVALSWSVVASCDSVSVKISEMPILIYGQMLAMLFFLLPGLILGLCLKTISQVSNFSVIILGVILHTLTLVLLRMEQPIQAGRQLYCPMLLTLNF